MDLGTGDGRAVLARAIADPDALVLGVDAAAPAMADVSRSASRAGVPNALFLAGGVGSLAAVPWLAGVGDVVTMTFPWGSLMRGGLGLGEPDVLCGVAAVLTVGARVEVLVSVVPSDGIDGMACLDAAAEPAIRAAWREVGLELDLDATGDGGGGGGIALLVGATARRGPGRPPGLAPRRRPMPRRARHLTMSAPHSSRPSAPGTRRN